MFEKEKKYRAEDAETIIGSGVKVEGTFVAFGNVTVKGTVSGSVETKNDLRVEDGALIEADAKANNAFVAGAIKGNLKAEEKIKLSESAHVAGDLECKTLSVEEGAIFNGRCTMGGGKTAEVKEE